MVLGRWGDAVEAVRFVLFTPELIVDTVERARRAGVILGTG